jgi:uncharacterized membrane protein required for colicin V production
MRSTHKTGVKRNAVLAVLKNYVQFAHNKHAVQRKRVAQVQKLVDWLLAMTQRQVVRSAVAESKRTPTTTTQL